MSFTLQTYNLTRFFGKTLAVNGISLNVPQNAVYGFLGPNGAGKTTSIRMILGLIGPNSGEVHIFGRPFVDNKKAILKRVGSLVETPSLYPHLTGFENLEIYRTLLNIDKKHIRRALAMVRMEQDAGRLVKEYSLGMKQRLGLALALLAEPELLILDEPTNGLDPAGIIEVRELLRNMPSEHGVTVFLSSHLLNEVEQIASSIGIIDKGKMLFEGTLDDLHRQQHSHIAIEVDQQQEAAALLQASGWKVQLKGTNALYVNGSTKIEAGKINQTLLQNNVHVYHLSLQRSSLEEMFLHMTTEQHDQEVTQ